MSGVAVVLSGGGARGAYEVGVLDVVLREIGGGRRGLFDFVCGTSVGAVNGAYLAGVADDLADGLGHLVDEWTSLQLEHLLGFGWREATGLRRVWLGGRRAASLFDGRRLATLARQIIPWRRLKSNLESGVLRALTVTATEVATGAPVVFVERSPNGPLPLGLPDPVQVRERVLGPAEVLASAAIPLIFPAVDVDGALYVDGGLRLNTPMAPAVHLGADRLLVVGLTPEGGDDTPSLPPGRYPGAAFLLGKVLDAFLGDHVRDDLDELERINRLLEDGTRAWGPDFVDRLNAAAAERGAPPRRIVRPLTVRPSVDLGRIAAEHLRTLRPRFGQSFGRVFVRLLDLGEGADADLASYLLFDGRFARDLVELGRADARARRDEIEDFLAGSTTR